MRVFLIRHGETEHNVAGLLAGVTDSRLTNHGVLQTQRLGKSLVKDRGFRFTNIYSSDLQRAFMTAEEICRAHNSIEETDEKIEVVKLEILREQDFGSLELVSWSSKSHIPDSTSPDFKPKETVDSMKNRANGFLDDCIVPLLALEHERKTVVAIVSHGLFLARLWRTLLAKFRSQSVNVSSDVATSATDIFLRHVAWSNTGYLEIDITVTACESPDPTPQQPIGPDGDCKTSAFIDARMTICAINDKRHLLNMKRARGGIGSTAHDQRQQSIHSFFKKSKRESAELNTRPREIAKK